MRTYLERGVHASIFALIVLVGAGSGRAALVIDNFEQGAFSVQAVPGPGPCVTQVGLIPANCIDDRRQVCISTQNQIAGADLQLGAPDDEVVTVLQDASFVAFHYFLGPVDLTGGGSLHRIDVRLPVAAGGASLTLFLNDAMGGFESEQLAVGGSGTFMFFLSDFTGVDLTQITVIQVRVDASSQGDFHIADITAYGQHERPLGFDVANGEVAGPPYPTGNLRMDGGLNHPPNPCIPPGPCEPMETLSLRVDQAMDMASGASLPLRFVAMDSNGGGGGPGEQVAIDVVWNGPPIAAFPASSMFDVHVALAPPDETMPVMGVSLDPFLPATGFLEASFPVNYFNAAGNLIAEDAHMLLFDAGNQPLTFSMPAITPNEGFHLTFGLSKTNGLSKAVEPDLTKPLFTITLTAAIDLTAATSVGLTPLESTPALSARPSVMTTRTDLWLSAPATRLTWIDLYGVAGRWVRRLEVPAGASWVPWDGRDESGQDAASGVYLARFVGGPGPVCTRLVKLR